MERYRHVGRGRLFERHVNNVDEDMLSEDECNSHYPVTRDPSMSCNDVNTELLEGVPQPLTCADLVNSTTGANCVKQSEELYVMEDSNNVSGQADSLDCTDITLSRCHNFPHTLQEREMQRRPSSALNSGGLWERDAWEERLCQADGSQIIRRRARERTVSRPQPMWYTLWMSPEAATRWGVLLTALIVVASWAWPVYNAFWAGVDGLQQELTRVSDLSAQNARRDWEENGCRLNPPKFRAQCDEWAVRAWPSPSDKFRGLAISQYLAALITGFAEQTRWYHWFFISASILATVYMYTGISRILLPGSTVRKTD